MGSLSKKTKKMSRGKKQTNSSVHTPLYSLDLLKFIDSSLTLFSVSYIRTQLFKVSSRAFSPRFSSTPCLALCFLSLQLLTRLVDALNVGIQSTDASVSASNGCSRKCESDFCSVPPLLRYGKYCGLLYSGCPGEQPCDGLDACCKVHDDCVQARNRDYLSQSCSQHLLYCISIFKYSDERTFKGNKCKMEEVVDVISVVIEAALVTGKLLRRP